MVSSIWSPGVPLRDWMFLYICSAVWDSSVFGSAEVGFASLGVESAGLDSGLLGSALPGLALGLALLSLWENARMAAADTARSIHRRKLCMRDPLKEAFSSWLLALGF